jgi:hypothetical protein
MEYGGLASMREAQRPLRVAGVKKRDGPGSADEIVSGRSKAGTTMPSPCRSWACSVRRQDGVRNC